MLVSRISPAPRSTGSRAHATASRASRSVPERTTTSYAGPRGPARFGGGPPGPRPSSHCAAPASLREWARPPVRSASIEATTHCEPNRAASSVSSPGRRSAAVFTATLSAPASRRAAASATPPIPPPTVSGSDSRARTAATVSRRVPRPSGVAVTSSKTTSSAPLFLVCAGQPGRVALVGETAKPDALHNPPVTDVQAGHDANREHDADLQLGGHEGAGNRARDPVDVAA